MFSHNNGIRKRRRDWIKKTSDHNKRIFIREVGMVPRINSPKLTEDLANCYYPTKY